MVKKYLWRDPIQTALSEKYCPPEWAIFFEVASGVGVHGGRYGDAIAMGLFPSRGLQIHGFEVKQRRQDWLKEKKNPKKAEKIAQFCDFWWVVTNEEKVVAPNELPEPWGLQLLTKKHLEVVKKAHKLNPKPIERGFIAALLRRSHEEVERILADSKAVNTAFDKGMREGREREKDNHKLDIAQHEALKREVSAFKKKSGLDIDMWNGEKLGDAVNAILNRDLQSDASRVQAVAERLKRITAEMEEEAEGLRRAHEINKKEAAKQGP